MSLYNGLVGGWFQTFLQKFEKSFEAAKLIVMAGFIPAIPIRKRAAH